MDIRKMTKQELQNKILQICAANIPMESMLNALEIFIRQCVRDSVPTVEEITTILQACRRPKNGNERIELLQAEALHKAMEKDKLLEVPMVEEIMAILVQYDTGEWPMSKRKECAVAIHEAMKEETK